MGVPGLFRWLSQQSSRVSIRWVASRDVLLDRCGVLAIDANSLIHQAAQQTLAELGREWSEASFFERLTELIESIVERVSPQQGLIVAVDGVCPFAKVLQQRQRRYKSKALEDSSLEQQVRPLFDSNSITPGTNRMQRLDQYLERWFSINTDRLVPFGGRVFYSSHLVPGEGEHKMLAMIRQVFLACTSLSKGGSIVLHGIDGDLILLASLLQEQAMGDPDDSGFRTHSASFPNVYLLREETTQSLRAGVPVASGSDKQATRDPTRQTALIDMRSLVQTIRTRWNFSDVASFCSLVCLAGNDFLPTVPGFERVTDCLDTLLGLCAESPKPVAFWTGTCGSENMELSRDTFRTFLLALCSPRKPSIVSIEMDFLQHLGQVRFIGSHIPYQLARSGPDKGMLSYATFRSAHYVIESTCGRMMSDPTSRALAVRGGLAQLARDECSELICSMVESFLDGIEWTIRYYTIGCSSVNVDWYYPHLSAPMLLDLATARIGIAKEKAARSARRQLLCGGSFLNPLEQLLCVIPVVSFEQCLPSMLQQVVRSASEESVRGLDQTFPARVFVRTAGYRSGHELLILPFPDVDMVRRLVRSIPWDSTCLMRYQRRTTAVFVHSARL